MLFPPIDKLWLKYYGDDMLNTSLPKMNIYEYLKRCNSKNHDEIAIDYEFVSITYGEIFAKIDDAANGLAAMGIGEGDTIKETLNKSKCADCRANFLPDEGEKTQEYFVYFKFSRQNQAENLPARCVRRFVQRFLNMTNDPFLNWNGPPFQSPRLMVEISGIEPLTS